MICTQCSDGYCGECKKRNSTKDYADCDHAHRVPEPDKMRPEGWMTKVPAAERFKHLDRIEYSPIEIAFMLGLTVRQVRTFFRKPSERREGKMLLPATKASGQWVVLRDDFIEFLEERYGN